MIASVPRFISFILLLLASTVSVRQVSAEPTGSSPEWADADSLVGYWTGAYTRLNSALRVNVRIERDDSGDLQCFEEFPDWLYYGWLEPEPVTVIDDHTVVYDGLYGEARLVLDRDYREMIGPSGANTPPATLHLKRSVSPPRVEVTERVIRFVSDVPLEGTLVLPEGDGPHACVLLLHGRGCHTRNSLLRQARVLARYGVAAFAFDQRGRGASGGACETTTFERQTSDAAAALRALANEPALDSSRIGFKGGSAGAWTAQALAARCAVDDTLPDPAFMVTWIGPATSIEEQQRDSADAIAATLGLPPDRAALVQRHIDLQLNESMTSHEIYRELKEIESIAESEGWLESMFAPDDFPPAADQLDALWLRRFQFDPTEILRTMGTPYLAVFGADDDVVPVEINTSRLRALLDEAGNTRYRIVTVPGIGHSVEHGDMVRSLGGQQYRTAYYKFDRVEPRFFECTVEFLRELGMATR
ncbi:MAG: alpha/beta hydrolase family protein [Phycisphaerales bacterium]